MGDTWATSQMSLEERLLAKRRITETGCWEWTGKGVKDGGYGAMSWRGRMYRVHRLAAHLWHGLDLASGRAQMALHTCDNPPCFNPAHLFVGTQADNVADMEAKGRKVVVSPPKTHCPQGHEYTPENTFMQRGRKGAEKRCRTCTRARDRRLRAARRADDPTFKARGPRAAP